MEMQDDNRTSIPGAEYWPSIGALFMALCLGFTFGVQATFCYLRPHTPVWIVPAVTGCFATVITVAVTRRRIERLWLFLTLFLLAAVIGGLSVFSQWRIAYSST